MPRMYWFWPERARHQTLRDDEEAWHSYRRAARAAGLDLAVIAVDDVDVLAAPTGSRVYVRGEPVSRRDAFFHTKLYTWPMFQPDVWRSLATFQAVSSAGYAVLPRLELSLISNDKAATLMHLRAADDGWLPTLSVPTRDLRALRVGLADAGIGFPVAVKPSSWGSGMGVVRADSHAELLAVLRLASAAELTMVVQPWLCGPVADVRVYCVDRRPVAALRRTPGSDGAVANVTAGGQATLAAVPDELRERAVRVARCLDTPWLGVDFLHDGRDFHLSEVEIDAFVGPVTSRLPGMESVLLERFQAYHSEFGRWWDRRSAESGYSGVHS